MKTYETYAGRESNIDPYASNIHYGSRFRFHSYNSKVSYIGEEQPWLNAHYYRGGLSYAGHAEELLEMLKQLEIANNKVDPYLQLVADRVEERPGRITIKVGRQLQIIQIKAQKKRKSSLDVFLQPVTKLEKGGHVDAALDVLYDRVDDLLRTKQFAAMDALLQQAKVDSISVDIILGLLTASLPARSKLSARSKFYAEAAESIKKRGAWEDGLLAGLES